MNSLHAPILDRINTQQLDIRYKESAIVLEILMRITSEILKIHSDSSISSNLQHFIYISTYLESINVTHFI
jgi:hypothetical protein